MSSAWPGLWRVTGVHRQMRTYIGACTFSFMRILSRTRAGTRIQLSGPHCSVYTVCNEKHSRKTWRCPLRLEPPRSPRSFATWCFIKKKKKEEEERKDERERGKKERGGERKEISRRKGERREEKNEWLFLPFPDSWKVDDSVTNARHFISNGMPPIIVVWIARSTGEKSNANGRRREGPSVAKPLNKATVKEPSPSIPQRLAVSE